MGGNQQKVALEPQVGAACIDVPALQAADIIVSTTVAPISTLIRIGTFSVVSHAALYAGAHQIIEAVGTGVTKHSINAALADDSLAVAYRHSRMTDSIAAAIIAFASAQVGKSYSRAGAALAGMPASPTQLVLCSTVGSGKGTFFCSQLVIEAFKQGGLPLTNMPAGCVTPQNVVEISLKDLVYVGHLKGSPSKFPIVSG